MMYNKIATLLCIALLFGCSALKQETEWSIASPDAQLKVQVHLGSDPAGGELSFQVDKMVDGASVEIIEKAPLGLNLGENSGLQFVKKEAPQTLSDQAEFLSGKQTSVSLNYTQQKLYFKTADEQSLILNFRIYDDAVAFRYELEGVSSELDIIGEATGFNLPQGTAWLHPFNDSYESFYYDGVPLDSAFQAAETGFSFPALFKLGSQWLFITEAGHENAFYSARLEQDPEDHSLYRVEKPTQVGADVPALSISGDWRSLWRVMLIGELSDIVSSDLVKALNPKPSKDYSWVQPGRASWSWKRFPGSSRNNAGILKQFIDLGAEMGWEHTLIDANWNEFPDATFQDILAYAKAKNVGVWLWYNSGGEHNAGMMWAGTEQPRNKMDKKDIRRETFKQLQDWGVKGIKVDFFVSDEAERMQQYIDILEDAADFQLMVNFHGCTLPRGWSHTYPNLMTMEGVRASEYYNVNDEIPILFPAHNTILPFTRNVVGSMDYTPVYLTPLRSEPRRTTFAHELAAATVYESGVTHFADGADNYRKLPAMAQDYLRDIPVTWDEIKLLGGYPGKDVILARRKGKNWFVGGQNGEGIAKDWQISLKDLGISASAQIHAITDEAGNRDGLETASFVWPVDQPYAVSVAPYGGAVLMIQGK